MRIHKSGLRLAVHQGSVQVHGLQTIGAVKSKSYMMPAGGVDESRGGPLIVDIVGPESVKQLIVVQIDIKPIDSTAFFPDDLSARGVGRFEPETEAAGINIHRIDRGRVTNRYPIGLTAHKLLTTRNLTSRWCAADIRHRMAVAGRILMGVAAFIEVPDRNIVGIDRDSGILVDTDAEEEPEDGNQ